jgi:thiosulfate reductase cytochrome b subunit
MKAPAWRMRRSLSSGPVLASAAIKKDAMPMALSERSAASDTRTSDRVRAVSARREIIYRHSVLVRVTHWMNVLCLTLLLMSGLKLFNVHPALYWGNYGYVGAPTVFSIDGYLDRTTEEPVGIVKIGTHTIDTTGYLGVTYDSDGFPRRGAFPQWATLGADLALARDWHFLAAWLFVINGAIYLLAGIFSGHFRRDLAPSKEQLRPRHILRDVWDHMRLRRPRGEEAKRYNVLQKFAYLAVVFLLLPTILLAGLTMSPAVTAAFPFLFDLFGGRQSARTIHFIAANLLVLFVAVHVLEVVLSGAFNLMRSMITGRYVVKTERAP